MRIAYIVTEFPKATETFIARELVEYHRRGHEVRVFHLTRFRRKEVVHAFALPTLSWTVSRAYLFDRKVVGALARAVARRTQTLVGVLKDLVQGFRAEPTWLFKSFVILPKCLAFAEEFARWEPDHVHAGFATHPATAAWIAKRFTGIPYSVSCHAHDIFLTQAMLGTKLGEASFVRCISEYNRNFLLKRVPALSDVPMIINHVGVRAASMERVPEKKGDVFVVLYVGSLEVRKGVDTLLGALARVSEELQPWRAVIIGGGPELRRLERLATDLGIERQVEFRGARPVEEVERARGEANVQVVPSIVGPGGRTEGLPTVLVEALARRLPVIASDVTGVPELVVDKETGSLVPRGDEGALSKALLEVRREPAAAYARAERGRQRVVAEFDLDVTVAQQLELFARYSRKGPERMDA